MNRQTTREDIQRYLQRWQELKQQYGDHAVNVPEFNQLTKIIRYIQAQAMQRHQQQQQQQQLHQQQLGGTGLASQISFQQSQQSLQSLQPQPQVAQQQVQQNLLHLPKNQLPYMQMANGMAGGQGNGQVGGQIGQVGGQVGQVGGQVGGQVALSGMMSNQMGQMGGQMNQMGMMGMMGMNQQSPAQQSPQSLSQTPSMPHQQTPNFAPSTMSQNIGPNGPSGPQNGADVYNGTESPFSQQQMQLLKLQNQAAKILFKSHTNGFPHIPQNMIEMATNERLAIPSDQPNGVPATPSMAVPLPAPSAMGQGPIANQSPQYPFQQVATPSNSGRPSLLIAQGQQQQVDAQGLQGRNDPKQLPGKRVSRSSKSGAATPISSQPVDPNSIQPVTRPAAPPKEFTEYSKEVDLTNQLVVPLSKPNAQVDTFVLPKIVDELIDEIPYNALYTPQSKVRCPAILPTGIDVDDIMTTRESYILLQIDAELTKLRKQLGSASDEEEKTKLTVEIAKLELLPYQKNVRGKVLSQMWFSKSLLPNSHPNFLAIFAELSLDNVIMTEELYKQQLYSLVQAQNRKHQDSVSKILSFTTNKRERLNARKEKLERLNIKINSFHSQTAKEEQKKLEKMAKQRLQALKLNDEEAYLKLLDHTKDTRITHLLNQTNQFLDSLAQAVQSQQRDAQQNNSYGATAIEEKPMDDEKREKVDYYQVAHRIKEEVTAQPSILIGGQLKEYQLKGLQWMVSLFNNHLNGILADEMGLGKTIQTISLLTYLVEKKQIPGPFLVIVPLSTLTNWNLEFEKWAPALKKITYKGTPVQRKVMQYDIKQQNFQVLLTTFEYVIKDRSLLSKIKWVHMIIDEGHRMKNANSKLSETLTQFYHSDYRLILTGTPLQNNLPELWALLNFVLPKIFNSVKSFDEWFNTPFANTGGQDKIELSEEETLLVIRRLHKVLRPFLLRRLKKDVEKDLPNKIEKVIKCPMSSLQSKLYRMMLKYNALFAGDTTGGKKASTIKNANNQLMQLRKICNHPFVYEEVENLINPKLETNDIIWRVAGKFELLDRILPKFKKTGHRVLIFFQMTQIMDIMEDFLRLRGMKYMRLDGGTKSDDRTELLKLFNAPNSDYFCFLLSTRAGGLGLNLQTADTVVIFDSDWNPHQDLQAQDRAHRIGQKNEVRILRLITEDSIEEMILERAVAKLEIDGKVIQAGKFDNKSTSEEQEALLRALMDKEEERRLKGVDEEDDLDDDELNQIIARNDDELITFQELDTERALETRNASYPSRLFTDQELPEIYQRDPQQFYKTDEQLIEEYGRGNRERKTAVYDDNLTEEEWLKKIEGIVSDESDSEFSGKRKGRRRKDDDAKKRPFDDDDSSSKRARSSTPAVKAKGRPRSNKPKIKTSSNRSTPAVDNLSQEERLQLQNNTDIIYGNLLDYKENDRKLSDLFLVKPSKRLYPDYYVLIKHPLALDIVKRRINNKTYVNIREFLEDVHLIFSNARIYNEEGSIVYQDATTLENLVFDNYKELYPNEADWSVTLDFKEFDELHHLKPLAVSGTAVKQPVAPALNVTSAEDTVELTPFFDLKDLPEDFP